MLFYAGGFAPLGGIEVFLHGLILYLHERGWPLRLVCWGPRSPLLADLERRGVEVARSPWRWGCRWRWPDRRLLRWGRSEVERAGLVIFTKPFSPRIHRELAAPREGESSPPFLFITPYRPAELWPPPLSAGEQAAVRETLATFDAMVVQAETFRGDLEALGADAAAITRIPYLPPPRTPVIDLPPLESSVRIGYLGRLAAQKNLPYLIKSFHVLRSKPEPPLVGVTLHLFGDGPERLSLEGLVRRLDLEASVSFHGEIPRSEVGAVIDSCHLFAFTSWTEGQCLAGMEILARGRPLVATPVGALPDLIEEPTTGSIAPLHDAEAFARALLAVIDGLHAKRIAAQSIQESFSVRFNLEIVGQQYEALFGSLLEPGHE
ncbi:MAG: glycosyltransferase family 4 protein [Candidatus Tectomicrobia bacterium]|nr:glycosyltransferase family 4 protein [Candidatus Tectomicrobia bacterium]